MIPHHKLLIILYDGEHARFIRPNEANVLHTARTIDSKDAHHRSADLRSDRPGATFHSDSTAHHALTPRHDPHDMEKESFVRFIAEELKAVPGDSFDRLILAAPAYALNIIKSELSADILDKMTGIISKDLLKVPDDELWEHLKPFVPAANPARWTGNKSP
ncbi:host attachment family protein [Acidocella aminolytica]|jgi:protein required for attachment to host cells|uniref:Host attachment protein n=1 Tax=Acidocella aminolytica 101 = DSM 11237 TaxID=1120923 RepID=A0A0D6PJA7_9PROT|nr:host attachment family protein [Acidocella aminolytica]GAN81835.1 hypothetical protein Aam_123_001 [Acidocella aminolytica 101 = DSM 11237]GBQ42825.1 hypothetical protein AA11237_3077 [Acidocella aminolytica 101 = DSM 11237]SHE30918.1 Protein required for attachment to host cells [Acidocella aminolytica 101 = DSM 11237]